MALLIRLLERINLALARHFHGGPLPHEICHHERPNGATACIYCGVEEVRS